MAIKPAKGHNPIHRNNQQSVVRLQMSPLQMAPWLMERICGDTTKTDIMASIHVEGDQKEPSPKQPLIIPFSIDVQKTGKSGIFSRRHQSIR
jgi:hypothetical protein